MSKARDRVLARQREILAYMRSTIEEHGYSPTVREICDALGIRSTSTVHKDIRELEEQGFIHKDMSKPRTIVLTDGNASAPGREKFKKMLAEKKRSDALFADGAHGGAKVSHTGKGQKAELLDVEEEMVSLPVIGNVAAGTPILAQENIEDSFALPARYVRGNSFMLRVNGTSMINAGIMDGDLILVQQASEAHNGEIVVAMLDDMEAEE